MEKLKMQSKDILASNIEKIAYLFPQCITERSTEAGVVEQCIDFDALRQELSREIVEGEEERYQFTWPDKKKAILAANAPITKTLRPCREESVDFDNTENLYIEGDNLEVLKLLQENYHQKVKMIYIDPPYNTGSDFIYKDNFAQSTEEYLASSGQFDDAGNRLVENTDSNGRYHTNWLNMLYPRLRLAKNLLTEDGVIFISIDDCEVSNLKKICDEVFGEKNFVANIIWKKKYGIQNDAKYLSVSHDYILLYSKNISFFLPNLLPRTAQQDDRYVNRDNDIRGPWKSADFTVPHVSENRKYAITLPSGRIVTPTKGRSWGASYEDFLKLVRDNRIWFGSNGDSIPSLKKFLSEVKNGITATTVWDYDEVGHTDKAKKDLAKLMENSIVFDYPKPVGLIEKSLKIASSKDSLILDFFSGSATTAHAVMQLNAEDGGKRKFIMVQIPEVCAEGSEAYKAGYKNICEIGKERIRRAAQSIREKLTAQDNAVAESGEAALWDSNASGNEVTEEGNVYVPDFGFRVLKVDSSNMEEVYYTPEKFLEQELEGFESNIKADRSEEDLLFQVMLDLGAKLSSKIVRLELGGKTVYDVGDNYLLACFAPQVTEETITQMAQRQPAYCVVRDSSFADDSVAVNFQQIFATYSPGTERRVL